MKCIGIRWTEIRFINVGLYDKYPKDTTVPSNTTMFESPYKYDTYIITEKELQKVTNVECGNPEIKRAFLFACYTGLGLAECKVLKWSHITNNRLTIDRQKNSAEINLALSKTALELLGERQQSKNLIFDLTFNGKFISETSINRTLTNWVERAGVDKRLSFYCGRHTFAVRLLTNGANLKTVSDALAHKSTANTVKYLNYVNSLKDEATSNL